MDGDLSNTTGRVEVLYKGAWQVFSASSDTFDATSASVACAQLGLNSAAASWTTGPAIAAGACASLTCPCAAGLGALQLCSCFKADTTCANEVQLTCQLLRWVVSNVRR